MENQNFSTPILFIVFNRLDTVKEVFAAIRQIKPKRLYIASDGARKNKTGENDKVISIRNYILTNIDWDCEVSKLFQEENLGCGKGVSSAINWFFSKEDAGIILEDDCVPALSFFTFCTEMLEKYKDDERIMLVSGMNHLQNYQINDYSYHFSKGCSIWGWATWKRAWNLYDFSAKWFGDKYILETFQSQIRHERARSFKTSEIKRMYDMFLSTSNATTWDYQWHFCLYINSGLGIVPKSNLISNIGFCEEGTHCQKSDNKMPYEAMPLEELKGPIIHPPFVMNDEYYDGKLYDILLPPKIAFINKVINKLKKIVKSILLICKTPFRKLN